MLMIYEKINSRILYEYYSLNSMGNFGLLLPTKERGCKRGIDLD